MGWGLKQLDVVEDVLAHGRGVSLGELLRSFPTQTILWKDLFYFILPMQVFFSLHVFDILVGLQLTMQSFNIIFSNSVNSYIMLQY